MGMSIDLDGFENVTTYVSMISEKPTKKPNPWRWGSAFLTLWYLVYTETREPIFLACPGFKLVFIDVHQNQEA
ncbi:hypothetical protein THF1C08_130152 [Vibrio jasicida]|uniref:Uncharacterized protein n=1 Tax=Vibrio jasicida TaxID=766224 RepID=A0AAU9QG44_9VIBR|nr:hypothetical protein THF1C08_130152 [Vibrio jasicida]CAH1573786.1 hypothetical protein THF1A12_120149 [Vibrio jasicida]